MSFRNANPSSSQSLLRTISARLDAVSGIISTGLLIIALVATVLVTLTVVKPNIKQRKDLEKRLDTTQQEVDALKEECRHTLDRIEAYRDPFYISRIAREKYHFQPAAGGEGSAR